MTKAEIKAMFERLRFDPAHHLGAGDIRLTIAQQDEIAAVTEAREPISGHVIALARRIVQATGNAERDLAHDAGADQVAAELLRLAESPPRELRPSNAIQDALPKPQLGDTK